jgi:hypothetical protein
LFSNLEISKMIRISKLFALACASVVLLAMALSSPLIAQEPIRKVVRKIVGYDRVCRGNFCEMVPRYEDVEVVELPITGPSDPPAAPPVAYTAPDCADCPVVETVSDPVPVSTEPPATWSTPRLFANQPVRSWLRQRPVRSLFAARPLRAFLGRLFCR